MDFTLPLLAISSLLLLGKSNKGTDDVNKNVVDGKYKPKKQPEFKSELDDILKKLESKLEIEDLRDFLMGVAWVESKYYPSAVAYVTIDSDRWVDIKKIYKNNKYINQKYLWDYTGGLFQLFPSSALKTTDTTAIKNNPTTVFDPHYAIAYAIDFASRLEKIGADTWFDIRLGWASLKTLAEKPPDKVLEIENRIIKGIQNSGGDTEILYKYVSNRFDKYRSEYGFKKTLAYIKSLNIG
jgi:hypothetical protein